MSGKRTVLISLLGVLLALLTWVFLNRPGAAVTHPAAPQEPMPQAVAGIKVRVVARFTPHDQEPVRIAAHPRTGRLYVLGGGGDVCLLDLKSGKHRRVHRGSDYIEQPRRK